MIHLQSQMRASRQALSILLACAIGFVTNAEVKAVSVSDIMRVWQERERACQSVQVEWEEQVTMPAGWESKMKQRYLPTYRIAARNNAKLELVPPSQTFHSFMSRIELQGRQFFYSSIESVWNESTKQYGHHPYHIIFDGNYVSTISPNGTGNMYWPQASVIKRGPQHITVRPELRPLMMALRPMDKVLRSFDVNEYKLISQKSSPQQRGALLLQLGDPADLAYSLWVAPEQDYSIIRETTVKKGRIIQQLSVSYQRHDKLQWIPKHWEILTRLGIETDALTELRKGAVTTVSQDVMPSERFNVKLPVGAVVSDERQQPKRQEYIVTEGDGRRYISQVELGLTYEELLQPASEQLSSPMSSWWRPLCVAIVLLIAVTLLHVLRKRKDV